MTGTHVIGSLASIVVVLTGLMTVGGAEASMPHREMRTDPVASTTEPLTEAGADVPYGADVTSEEALLAEYAQAAGVDLERAREDLVVMDAADDLHNELLARAPASEFNAWSQRFDGQMHFVIRSDNADVLEAAETASRDGRVPVVLHQEPAIDVTKSMELDALTAFEKLLPGLSGYGVRSDTGVLEMHVVDPTPEQIDGAQALYVEVVQAGSLTHTRGLAIIAIDEPFRLSAIARGESR